MFDSHINVLIYSPGGSFYYTDLSLTIRFAPLALCEHFGTLFSKCIYLQHFKNESTKVPNARLFYTIACVAVTESYKSSAQCNTSHCTCSVQLVYVNGKGSSTG